MLHQNKDLVENNFNICLFWLFFARSSRRTSFRFKRCIIVTDRFSIIWTTSFPRFVTRCCCWSFVDDFWLHLMEERGSIHNLGLFYDGAYQLPTWRRWRTHKGIRARRGCIRLHPLINQFFFGGGVFMKVFNFLVHEEWQEWKGVCHKKSYSFSYFSYYKNCRIFFRTLKPLVYILMKIKLQKYWLYLRKRGV